MISKVKNTIKINVNFPKKFIINDNGNLIKINQPSSKDLNMLYQVLLINLTKINNYNEFEI